MSRLPVLLVHGAWQGAWAWGSLLPLLHAAGFQTVAVDLPGNGTDNTAPDAVSLSLYVEHLASVLAGLASPAHLVAHSGGGVPASQLAEAMPDRVASLAYVAGMMLPSGVSFAELVKQALPAHPEAAGIGPHLVWSEDGLSSRVPEQAALRFFFHDCEPLAAAGAAARLSPQPQGGRAVAPSLTPQRFGRVPRLYVEATGDRSVVPALQRRMCALLPGAERAVLPSGHVPQLAAPERLAQTLLPFFQRVEAVGPQGRPARSSSVAPTKERMPC